MKQQYLIIGAVLLVGSACASPGQSASRGQGASRGQSAPQGQGAGLACKFTKDRVMGMDRGQLKEDGGPNNGTAEMVFHDLDTDHPTYSTDEDGVLSSPDPAAAKLTVLRRNPPDAVFLAEYPPMGGVNVWTIFRGRRVMAV